MCCTFVPEASLVSSDDVSGNTGHSKSTISSGNKKRTNDEAASTSSMSTSTHNLVSFTHYNKTLVHVTIVYHKQEKFWERHDFMAYYILQVLNRFACEIYVKFGPI